jgi:GT2 family glycosyltransferase
MNKVYIVIVNYNKFDDTIECLESVFKSNYANFQIFVVDNSTDSMPVQQLLAWVADNNYNSVTTAFTDLVYPLTPKPIDHIIIDEEAFKNSNEVFENKITFVKAVNRGFAAANNVVLSYLLKKAEPSSFIWLLNNDTVIEKATLGNLVTDYKSSADIKKVLGAKLRYYDRPLVIQAVAGRYNTWLGRHKHIGDGEEDTGQYDNYIPQKKDYIVGASMFLPQLFIEQAGLMCEDYFLYFEELDWVKQGEKHGYTIAIAHNAIVYHKQGASITGAGNNKGNTTIAEYYSITNRVRFIKKWYPYSLPTVMIGVIWALVKRLFQGKLKLVKKSSVTIMKIIFTNKPTIH